MQRSVLVKVLPDREVEIDSQLLEDDAHRRKRAHRLHADVSTFHPDDAVAGDRFRGSTWMEEPCVSCARREIDFGGCRCQALLMTGSASATDPVCHKSPHHHIVTEAAQTARAATYVHRTAAGA
jgi:hypothetical protein